MVMNTTELLDVHSDAIRVRRVLERVFHGYTGSLGVHLWDGIPVSLRQNNALTLQHWVSRLEACHQEALAHVSEAQYRVRRLYMTACSSQFERGFIGVYQILAANRRECFAELPLTRRDLYP